MIGNGIGFLSFELVSRMSIGIGLGLFCGGIGSFSCRNQLGGYRWARTFLVIFFGEFASRFLSWILVSQRLGSSKVVAF